MIKKIILFLLLGLFQNIFCQNYDSLWVVYKNVKQADTNRLNAFNEITWNTILQKPDTGMILALELLKFAKKAGYKIPLARAYHNIGLAHYYKSNYKEAFRYYNIAASINRSINYKTGLHRNYRNIGDLYYYSFDYVKSLEYYNRALAIAKEIKDKSEESYYLRNIAEVYNVLPNYPKALDFFFKALKLSEEINYVDGMECCYRGIGDVYCTLSKHDKSQEYYAKALAINIKLGRRSEIANCYVQMANNSYFKKDYPASLNDYEKALAIYEELNDEGGKGNCYIGLANVYYEQSLPQKSLEYYLRSLKIKEKNGASQGFVISCINTGDMYYELGDYKQALYYNKKGLDSAIKTSQLFYMAHGYRSVAKAHAKLGNYKDAYEFYVKYRKCNDSIFNKENSKQLGDLRVNFEVEKKENELTLKAEAEQDKLKAIAKEEKKVQYIIIFSVGGILLIVITFSIFLYKRFRITKHQKQIIEVKSKETEFQKHLVEEKQKEIIDSITYAKRLQHAILPPKEFIDQFLADNFLIYRPKDIIAGDFYWMYVSEGKNEDQQILIAAADSTGHGVPGAMVSIVCSNALDKAVKEFGLTDPGQILDKTTDLVLETFAKSGEDIKDGMDISLLSIERDKSKQTKICWSGANNSLWYIVPAEDKTEHEISVNEIKANKQPVGKSDHRRPFTTHNITHIPGSVFYLMTDGFADQFGGPKGKKFKYKQLENIILTNFNKPLRAQCDIIANEFDLWRGNLDQVDDVTLIAIKV